MRVTQQHWEVFLNVAEKYPCLITSKFNGAQGKIEGHALWATLANKLNGLGLGEKSIAEWRRVSILTERRATFFLLYLLDFKNRFCDDLIEMAFL